MGQGCDQHLNGGEGRALYLGGATAGRDHTEVGLRLAVSVSGRCWLLAGLNLARALRVSGGR